MTIIVLCSNGVCFFFLHSPIEITIIIIISVAVAVAVAAAFIRLIEREERHTPPIPQ